MMTYAYDLVFHVRIVGDGQHADGDGAVATARRLERRLRADALVVDVRTSHPSYVGAPVPAGGEGTGAGASVAERNADAGAHGA